MHHTPNGYIKFFGHLAMNKSITTISHHFTARTLFFQKLSSAPSVQSTPITTNSLGTCALISSTTHSSADLSVPVLAAIQYCIREII
jgi:hypothetical protein